jgi:hypothetical protein
VSQKMNRMKNEKLREQDSDRSENKEEIWFDKQDILTRMHISSRTLQTWRDKGILPHCRIRNKIFYRESDLKKLFDKYIRKH